MGFFIAYLIVTPILGAIVYNIFDSKDWEAHSDNITYLVLASYAAGTAVYICLAPMIFLLGGIASFF